MANYATSNSQGPRGHILIVEQNPATSRAASSTLRENRFQTTIFNRGHYAGGNRSFSDYDLVLLEHQQRKQEACLRILQRLREVSPVPIVVLSDEPSSSAKILALETGADDFLSRPYLNRELIARIKAILRRSRLNQANRPAKLLTMDHKSKQVSVRGRAIDLTQREFEMLAVLAAQPGRNFTRDEILHGVWGAEFQGDKRRVDLYISRIRAKMHSPNQDDLIRSIYGVGYRLEV